MENGKRAVARRLVQVLIALFIQMFILFLSAGTIKWPWAWVLFGISILVMFINALVLPRELISERGNPGENVKIWDKTITVLSIVPILGVYIVSGLDQRFNWTAPTPLWLNFSGALLMIIGNAVFSWAMVSNKYFSTKVRIQNDRDHKVATAGPYKMVRHPGYTGFIIQTIATALMLGSLWGLIPACFAAILFIIRTTYEDAALKQELQGYQEYADRVRYRLIPGVW